MCSLAWSLQRENSNLFQNILTPRSSDTQCSLAAVPRRDRNWCDFREWGKLTVMTSLVGPTSTLYTQHFLITGWDLHCPHYEHAHSWLSKRFSPYLCISHIDVTLFISTSETFNFVNLCSHLSSFINMSFLQNSSTCFSCFVSSAGRSPPAPNLSVSLGYFFSLHFIWFFFANVEHGFSKAKWPSAINV